jgi:hypothetical protein
MHLLTCWLYSVLHDPSIPSSAFPLPPLPPHLVRHVHVPVALPHCSPDRVVEGLSVGRHVLHLHSVQHEGALALNLDPDT